MSFENSHHISVDATTASASNLRQKYAHLQAILADMERVAVAFSAGVDSTLLLKVAVDTLGAQRVVAVTGESESLPRAQLDEARQLVHALAVEHVILDTNELSDPRYAANPVNRCYYCKTTLYSHMNRWAQTRGDFTLLNGTNADDLGDHRPGLAAADEFHVRAPLAEAGMGKQEVRELSRQLALPTFAKPASPCLSSRVAYGEAITPEKLQRIEAAETFLHQLGFAECRVRLHDAVARIEVPAQLLHQVTQADAARKIDAHFRSLGFLFVTLDLRGLRSGSLNEMIPLLIAPERVQACAPGATHCVGAAEPVDVTSPALHAGPQQSRCAGATSP